MSEKILKDINERRHIVEAQDQDIQKRNRDYFRNFWMNIIILSSGIIIGVLPLLDGNSDLVQSLLLAKLGLLTIVFITMIGIVYFENVLRREKLLLFDQQQFHNMIFSEQESMIRSALNQGRKPKEVLDIFNLTKSRAFEIEQAIIKRHLLGGAFSTARLFLDQYFSRFLTYGFILGILLIIASTLKVL